jgi:hypothetical protein
VADGVSRRGRNANLVSFLWPERVKAPVSVSGYLVGSQAVSRCHCRQALRTNGGICSISPQTAVKLVQIRLEQNRMPEESNQDRRLLGTFFASSAIVIASAELGIIGSAEVRCSKDDLTG